MKAILTSILALVFLVTPNVLNGIYASNLFFYLYPFSMSLLGFVVYKRNFKNPSQFKFFMLRRYVSMKSNINTFIKKQTKSNFEETPIHWKAKKLWTSLLKDPKTKFTSSLITKDIHLENNNFLLCLNRMNEVDYLLTIFNVTNQKSYLYEVTIKDKLAEFFIDSFNEENEKRLEKTKQAKMELINKDLTKLCDHFTRLTSP